MPTYCERKTEIATEKQAEIEEKEAFFTFDDSQSGNEGRSMSRQQAIWDQWHGPQLNTLVSRANRLCIVALPQPSLIYRRTPRASR